MKRLILGLLLQGLAIAALAAPAALGNWEGWLRDKHPDLDCPRIAAQLDRRRCVWPGRMLLRIEADGAQFEQNLQVSGVSWVALPGDADVWPLQVTVNGRPAPVLERDGLPALRLEPGDHLLRGRFHWISAPQFLRVPADAALFELRRDGAVSHPTADDNDRIWLRTSAAPQGGSGDAVKVEVFRRLDDNLPCELTTVLRLSVSGKPRELVLGRLLLKDLEPLAFESPLPARIENDGRLRIQARAGEWSVTLRARFTGDINRVRMERLDEQWPAQEIWTYAANQSLRRAKVSGVTAVDPSQLDLPADFAGLPTYLIEPDSELVLEQQYRGDATPAANELTIEKTLWLDFEGGGATLRDSIRGRMFQTWRLQAMPGIALGRVTVNGEPQLITQLGKDGAGGVEIRDTNVQVEALSRVESAGELSAAGWHNEFSSARLSLQLPPGWKLWHAGGPDAVHGSWLSQWNLWNIFLALLLVGAIYRLFEWKAAALALLAVALTYHEADAPVLYFIPVLIAIALLRVLEPPKLRGFVVRLGYLFALALVLVLLAFAVAQMRTAIYPQLGIDREMYPAQSAADTMDVAVTSAARMDREMMMAKPAMPIAEYAAKPRRRYEPSNNVQTGPGVPAWSWREATLQWSGPVAADDSLQLYLSSPWLTRALNVLNVALSVALSLLLLRAFWHARAQRPPQGGADRDSTPDSVPPHRPEAAASLLPGLLVLSLLALGLVPVSPAQAQEFPPKYLLDEFEQRLTLAPDCAPNCAVLEAALVHIDRDQISIQLRVAAGAAVGVPLPTLANWQPRSVLVDGVVRNLAAREGGAMLLPLARGEHQVVLEGPLDSDDISLQFPLLPHDVAVIAEQWDVFGLNGRKLGANSLQLQKRERSARHDALVQAAAKPFVHITRRFDLDIDWVVTTTVTRVAPQQGAINLSVPLLAGESVVSAGVEVKENSVAVSLGSQQASVSWRSVMKPVASLQLTAPQTQHWVEIWEVAAAPRWHVTGSGLNPVKSEQSDAAQWRWQPWPGESLTLAALQPAAVPGVTTTVENATLALLPARHGSDFNLQFDASSSVGGDYQVQLHEPGELKYIRVNGVDISQSRGEGKVLLPLTPGKNRFDMQWRLERGVDLLTRTPQVSLATAGSNINLQLTLPRDRWPLWVSGPRLGPAMLFWGVLIVIAGLAYGLGRLVERTGLSIPLRAPQWLLLAIGMSTISVAASVPVVLWFFAMEARAQLPMPLRRLRYNLIQIGLLLLTLVAAVALLSVIPRSLLSLPDMQVSGNGSYDYFYRWYQDRSSGQLPQASVFSVSIWIYRLAMLLWSLWLVFALLRWIKWGWQSFVAGGLWMNKPDPIISPAVEK